MHVVRPPLWRLGVGAAHAGEPVMEHGDYRGNLCKSVGRCTNYSRNEPASRRVSTRLVASCVWPVTTNNGTLRPYSSTAQRPATCRQAYTHKPQLNPSDCTLKGGRCLVSGLRGLVRHSRRCVLSREAGAAELGLGRR